ncbi:MAG: V-type ATP synthase subunit B, partial [Pseudomonadota bacterium]
MIDGIMRYSRVTEIVGDILRVHVPRAAAGKDPVARLGDLAVIENGNSSSPGQVIAINRDTVSLQIFAGTKGISTTASVTFLGRPMQVAYSDNILGRVLNGAGETVDGGPDLSSERQVTISGPSVNPVERVVPKKIIRTDVPMIDLFNCLVESQKIPIFSVSGEPYNPFLARIGIQADADIVVFGGMGL